MIESPILTRRTSNFNDIINGSWYFCANTLHEVFDFPKGVKRIQFQAWLEPGRGRVKIRVKRLSRFLDHWDIEIDGENQGILCGTMSEIMKLTKKRRTWYVKMYYWI